MPLSQAHNACATPAISRFSIDLQLEMQARAHYEESATCGHSVEDYVTHDLFELLVHDAQKQIDDLETQLDLVAKLSLELYASRSPRSARFRSARQLPVRPDKVTRVAVRIAFQIILVLRLGLPKGASRGHFGHHLARPKP